MESYRDFARVYDEFMDQTPYDEWFLNILNIFKEYKIDKDAQVLDLGCGTGKMARKLAREGYQVTAVDNSMDMLEIAASEEDDHILYVLQDMVSLELPQQVDAAVSICDCMNYILEEEDLKEAFRRVREFLKEDGVFVFDPRMRATYMEAGNMKEADIISTVKNGIFVDTFTNGQVQIGAGDFTFFVKSGYLIEDGKLTQPIKDINIIGNGPKALADITMVADNDKIDNGTWTCGKDGQSCPVTCGMPSALVSKLTVGGES